MIYSESRDHRDPPNLLPEPNRGRDVHTVSVPGGVQLSHWLVEVEATSPGSGYRVVSAPQSGVTGRQQIVVEWWFGAFGQMKYRLKVFASPDGRSSPVPIVEGQSGWTEQFRDKMQQQLPIALKVRGPQAQVLQAAMAQKGVSFDAVAPSRAMIAPAIIIVVVIGIVIALGMLVFGAILKEAMEKGYDVKDTKYKAAAGSGPTRQEHEMVFNLHAPQAQPEAVGSNASEVVLS
jgi:hypothetical protein